MPLSVASNVDDVRTLHMATGSCRHLCRSRIMLGDSGPNAGAHAYPAPIIVMSGKASIAMAVEAVKNGAFDIIEKPFSLESIVARVRDAAEAWARRRSSGIESLPMEFPGCQPLTQREAEVLAEIAAASSNKEAGRRLGISPRTVEVHRARIMMKLGAKN